MLLPRSQWRNWGVMYWVRLHKKNFKKRQKNFFCSNWFFILCWFIPVIYLVQTDQKNKDKITIIRNNIPNLPASGCSTLKKDIKRIWNSSRRKNDEKGRMYPLLFSYFSGCKNKRIKQKTNPAELSKLEIINSSVKCCSILCCTSIV